MTKRTGAQRVAKNIADACVYGDWFDLPAATLMVADALLAERRLAMTEILADGLGRMNRPV